MADPCNLDAPNKPSDRAKVYRLAKGMEENGWQGYPLVVHEGSALNGSHRLEAARRAGLGKVPTLTVHEVARVIGVDLDEYRSDGRLVTSRLMRDWYLMRDEGVKAHA